MNTLSQKICLICLVSLISLISPAHAENGTVTRTLTLSANGTVVAPAGFWTTNNASIRSALGPLGNLTFSGNATTYLNGSGNWTVPPAGDVTAAGNNTFTGNNTYNGTVTFSGNATFTQQKYPLIHIQVPPGQAWTDFELKASTINFSTGSTADFYWYHSPIPEGMTGTGIGDRYYMQPSTTGPLPDVYFTDSGTTRSVEYPYDVRSWIKQDQVAVSPATAPRGIFDMLKDGDSVVGGFVIVLKDSNGWFAANRNKLVFSYSLLTAVAGERDGAGRSIWRPATPVAWVGDDYQPSQDHVAQPTPTPIP